LPCWIGTVSNPLPAKAERPGILGMRRAHSGLEARPSHARSYKIRSARVEDIGAIAELESMVFGDDAYSKEVLYDLVRGAPSGRPSPSSLAGDANAMDVLSLPSNCCAIYVADSSGRIIGYSIAQIRVWGEFLSSYGVNPDDVLDLNIKGSSRVGYLKSIAVHPNYRRYGIGKQFHAVREAFLRDQGIQHVVLLQMPNPGLEDFHHSLGFSEISASPSLEYAAGGRARLWYRPIT
jgi:N-acetylglutamate synthase-like GNAT family acetyltransferase